MKQIVMIPQIHQIFLLSKFLAYGNMLGHRQSKGSRHEVLWAINQGTKPKKEEQSS